MNEFDDYAGEYDDVDLEACDEILGPNLFADENGDEDFEDFWDCDEEEEQTMIAECYECETCFGCIDCQGCALCVDCVYCTDCNGCEGCVTCVDCKDCIACQDCVRCTGLRGCIGWRDNQPPTTHQRQSPSQEGLSYGDGVTPIISITDCNDQDRGVAIDKLLANHHGKLLANHAQRTRYINC